MPDLHNDMTVQLCNNPSQLLPLYRELLEDERDDRLKTEQQCHDDLESFLKSGEKAYLFLSKENVLGYALVARDIVGYAIQNTRRKHPYIHHFYITRGNRRKGYGRKAFHLLLETLGVTNVDLEVFVWNERGIAFWRSLGFEPRTYMMRMKDPQ